jgi:hypothetical protein
MMRDPYERGMTTVLLVARPSHPKHRRQEGVTVVLGRTLGTLVRGDPRDRLAEAVALHLRERLPEDHIVLARYAPRDHGDRIPVVVVGRERIFVIEPRDDAGDLVCYQDHWYRRSGVARTHPLSDSPSLRAARNVARVRNDLGTGGFMNVPIDALVVLSRGRAEDVGSSCVPVVAGLEVLVARMTRDLAGAPSPEHTHALADALARNIRLATV